MLICRLWLVYFVNVYNSGSKISNKKVKYYSYLKYLILNFLNLINKIN